jgi:D-glycero-beta-D-manno-heptose 1-phosphate adenylyltransferase
MFKLSAAAKRFLDQYKNKKIVFTNGCFDLLHVGHILYLKEAQHLGDVLFIGLNSDDSVRKLKGLGRPVNNQSDRKLVLENLRCVDFVEIFSEDTPLELIKAIRPQILVKGGDWKVEQIVGSDFVASYGGITQSLHFKEGYSTTNLIQAIQKK